MADRLPGEGILTPSGRSGSALVQEMGIEGNWRCRSELDADPGALDVRDCTAVDEFVVCTPGRGSLRLG
jgi:hypothetical protein